MSKSIPTKTLQTRQNLKDLVQGKEFQDYHSMEVIRLHIATRMKKIREEKKMTQTEMAEIMGVKQSYLTGIESGKRNPNISTISKFCKAIGGKLEIIY